ncbi:MMPL family transporter [Gammaproteobacteria bacterium]|nr:MMPL family transporter [Gammaproteobacteria bacterium]
MAVTILLTIGAGYYAITAFSMNSDNSLLIRQDTDWKHVNQEFLNTFPQYDQNTFVVVSGNKPHQVSNVASQLANKIREKGSVFRTVYSPTSSQFAQEHALLYLEPDTLNDTISKLADAQPFLTAVATDDSLRSVLELVVDALNSDESLPTGFTRMLDALSSAAEQALTGDSKPISWRDELFQVKDDTFYQVIFIQGQQNFGEDLPNAQIIAALQSTIADLSHPYREYVTIRLTGQVPLEHQEIVSALDSAQLAGTLALIILVLVLTWGIRSMWIVAAVYLTMIVGLIWTAAFAMITIGQYNTISIIFLVMFIGLGVDFAVHICLKFQEARLRLDKKSALIETGTELGPAIMLCGLTSAIGFLAFVPTEYIGLAEMGIISGGGMIIAVVLSLTLIPVFFALSGDPRPATDVPLAGLLSQAVAKNSTLTSYITFGVAAVLTLIATQAQFDYSTLSLKDPKSEAMETLIELQREDIITDFALTYVAADLDEANNTREALEELAVVSDVRTPTDYLPVNQEENLYILEDARFFLDSLFAPPPPLEPWEDENLLLMLSSINTSLHNTLLNLVSGTDTSGGSPELVASLSRFKKAVSDLKDASSDTRELHSELIVPPIKNEIEWLKKALEPDEVTLERLPTALQERLIAKDGRALVSITPEEDVVPVEAMRRFTTDVMAVVPEITGRPVLDLGIGDIVITAFQTAILIAVLVIFLILLITLRSLVDSILVFIPLAMTAMLTLSVSVLMDLPLNMANVVVIPLIFGLGVDNGIHIVKRFHQSSNVEALMHSSTPKAVFLSNLTTLGTFSALSFSSHQGIYSIGILLTIALTSLIFLTLVSLPALLATFSTPHSKP